MREINEAGLSIIKKWEGILDGDPSTVNLDPYLDPVNIWTIGWGHAVLDTKGKFVRGIENKARAYALYPNGITMPQAELLLATDCIEASKDVEHLAPANLTHNQFSALVSFEFNTGALGGSTLLKKLRVGDILGASNEFGKWVKGTDPKTGLKVTLPGLVTRRAEERALFLD